METQAVTYQARALAPQPHETPGDSSSTETGDPGHGPLIYRKWIPGSSATGSDVPQEISVQDLLSTKILELKGTHVFFFPRITDIQKDAELVEKLAEVFHTDSYFLSQSAYESNGFFHIEEKHIDGFNGTCISSSSRALVKEIWQPSHASSELINRVAIANKKEDSNNNKSEIASVCDTAAEVLLHAIMDRPPGIIDTTAESLAKRAVAATPSAPDAEFNELVAKFENAHLDPNTSNKLSDLLIGQIHRRECIMKDLRSDQNVEKPQESQRGLNLPQTVVEKRPIKYMYHWLFLSFFTLWLKPLGDGAEPAQIILCFDDAHGKRIERAISKASTDLSCPYSLISRLAESVTLIFDDALWSFRTPIRQIEKNRADFSRNAMRAIVHGDNADTKSLNLKDGIIDVYAQMHELARHVIHFQETIEAAKTCTRQMVESASLYCKDGCSVSRIKHWALLAHNLKPRADGFKERVQNEISLAYNTVNAQQLGEARSLLQESRSDGKHISWMVGFLSIVFLPGTFVSGFFSMTFFDSETRGAWWHDTPNGKETSSGEALWGG
ncbi:uncharacterized protein BJX67DRAFT_293036 [Aspergillus lucknowensis]|uniref:Uncharacterized protein n=1 Tax=Aspergillus lucknowensis TaxID=176173 RepID=A0ABR4LDM8_9EURO